MVIQVPVTVKECDFRVRSFLGSPPNYKLTEDLPTGQVDRQVYTEYSIQPADMEDTFVLAAHLAFSDADHTLGHKADLKEHKEI